MRTTYNISDGKTSNQNSHWKLKHFDHFFDFTFLPALKDKTADEIASAKEREWEIIKPKKQLRIASFMPVSGIRNGASGVRETSLNTLPPRQATTLAYNRARARGRLIDLVVCNNLPFTFVESPEFAAYLQELNPKAAPISATILKDDIMHTLNAAQERIKELLKVSFCAAGVWERKHFASHSVPVWLQENTSKYSISLDL